MLEETLKILKQYTTDEINANTAEEIESNIKTFFEIIVEWNEKIISIK